MMKTPFPRSTVAMHMYSSPWLASRGSKVNIPTKGDTVESITSLSLLMVSPLESVHVKVGVGLSGCSKVTVQLSVYMYPAVEVPVLSMSTTGAAGTIVREREDKQPYTSYRNWN